MTKLEIGQTYLDRTAKEIKITRAVTSNEEAFAVGYRFEGEYVVKGVNHRREILLFDGNGKNVLNVVSTPSDIVCRLTGISVFDIDIGSQVGDMHGHQITKGTYKDWELSQSFEIPKDMFEPMYDKLGNDKPYSGKTGYVVSTTEDVRGNASAILIIYEYDGAFRCAHLIAPEWKLFI